jgi:hypothetical protein
MYRQGLGDCFLLTFPSAAGERHVLIDCGVLKGTEDAAAAMRAVAGNIMTTTGGALAALIVTHEHWDHVSGFVQAGEVLKDLKPAEVWLAWTEDTTDDLANELSTRRKKAHAAVEGAARQLAVAGGAGATRVGNRLNALLEFSGLGAAPGTTTADGMAWPKARPGADVRYFRPGEPPHAIPGVEGVRVYVLGPPHDRKQIKKSDPSKKAPEVYELAGAGGADGGLMAAVDALASGDPATDQPFDAWFRVSDKDAATQKFFQMRYGFDDESTDTWRRIEDDWLGATGRLALQLDSDTNNTSLALAFELVDSGRVLLFPGDAQVGNWISWDPLTWTLTSGGESRTVSSHDLLARTVLYKVGHHGSHNATLREKGLELMTHRELAAMIPVNRKTAKKLGWNMPFPTLFNRLSDRTRGRILDLEFGVRSDKPAALSDDEWAEFQRNTEVQPGWIDYWVVL